MTSSTPCYRNRVLNLIRKKRTAFVICLPPLKQPHTGIQNDNGSWIYLQYCIYVVHIMSVNNLVCTGLVRLVSSGTISVERVHNHHAFGGFINTA